MDDSNIKLNRNVQRFIKMYGITNDNNIINGIQKLILYWCGSKEDGSNIPKTSFDIFKSMSEKDLVLPLQL